MKNFFTAVIRTVIAPPITAVIMTWLLKLGFQFDSTKITVAVVFIINGVYYCLLHLVEVAAKNPKVKKWAGIFLGSTKQPEYK